MARLIVNRLLASLAVLVGVSILTFMIAALAPGDPLTAYVRPGSDVKPEDLAQLRESLGFNAPIHVRYLTWLGQVLGGNFGTTVLGVDVGQLLATRLPDTLKLMGLALLLSASLGTVLGVTCAFRYRSRFDNVLSTSVFFGVSLPVYLTALIAIFFFSVQFRNLTGISLFPPGGLTDPNSTLPRWLDELWHLILPCLVLSFTLTAYYLRYARASVLEVLGADHVRTARSKGLTDRAIKRRHVLRNALLPLITVTALQLPMLVTGAVFVETIFRYPGIGLLAIEATKNREYNVIMAVTMLASSAIVVSNLVADILYGFADPRIRRG